MIEEQNEIINKAKRELEILWKIEIDNTISNKKERLSLPETAENKSSAKGNGLKALFGLGKMKSRKTCACVRKSKKGTCSFFVFSFSE